MAPTGAPHESDDASRNAAPPRDRRDELADRITEQAVQLLYTARQDIAEVREELADDRTLQQAQFRVLDAIQVLRGVAAEVRSPSWDLTMPARAPVMPRPRVDREAFAASVRAHHADRQRWACERADRDAARARRRQRLSR